MRTIEVAVFLAVVVGCNAPASTNTPVAIATAPISEPTAQLTVGPIETPTAIPSRVPTPSTPSASPGPSPTVRPIDRASPEPPETFVVDGVAWRRYDPRALPDIGGFYSASVWPSNGRFLAEAYRSEPREQLLLESSNGETWSLLGRITTEPDLVEALIETEFGYFAGGTLGNGGRVLGLWRSTDGRDWEPVADSLEASCGRSDGLGYIYAFDLTESGPLAKGSGDWVTTNGIEWRCVTTIPNVRVVSGHGVSVGSGDGMWFSTDGLTWEPVEGAPANFSDVAVVRDGFVALGRAGGPGDQVLSVSMSRDGRNWVQQDNPFGDHSITRLTWDGDRAIAIDEGGFEQGAGAVWISSRNGETWRRHRLPSRDGDSADGVAILGDRVVVIGTLYADNSIGTMVVWVADIP